MKTFRTYALGFSLCLTLLFAQESHRRPLPDIPPEPVPRPQRQPVDPARLQREANELATLASSVPPDVEKIKSGVLPKDLEQKLKHIEKLAKHLRKDLSE